MTSNSLAGARVLGAGASSGIGRAFAVGAVKDGARVTGTPPACILATGATDA
jgi:NAD(P)-dependent dehydrogenase (short-subunit alcohol dehydrogenase family)